MKNGFGQENKNMDLTKMTRAQAERLVAGTNDRETLKLLGDHKNKHVRAKAGRKFKKAADVEALENVVP